MHNTEDYLRRAEWDAWWAQHRRWVELFAPDLFGTRAAGRDEPPPAALGPGTPGPALSPAPSLPAASGTGAAAAPAAGATAGPDTELDFEGLFALIEAALGPDQPDR